MTGRNWLHFAAILTISASMAGAAAAQQASSDLAPVPASEAAYGTVPADVPPSTAPEAAPAASTPAPAPASTPAAAGTAPVAATDAAGTDPAMRPVFSKSEVLSAAENAFGRGAEGLARMIETIFKDLGEPNAYIVGREAGGAIGIGLRYGSGTLYHKIEGDMPVYWRGPSLGFDVGGDANKTFTLIYHLYDTEDLFRAYPAAEGKVYVVGGLTAKYEQRGDIIIVPIKLGVGWRLGVNAGYVRYSKKGSVIPF
jgi:hypothetical protein